LGLPPPSPLLAPPLLPPTLLVRNQAGLKAGLKAGFPAFFVSKPPSQALKQKPRSRGVLSFFRHAADQ
jgi:hypothetical protein